MKYFSPPYLVLYSCILFNIAFLLPNWIYYDLVGEYGYVFLNFKALLFFYLCATSFIVSYNLFPSIDFRSVRFQLIDLKYYQLILIGSFLCFSAIFILYETLVSQDLIVELLLSGNGSIIKEELAPDGFGGLFNIFLISSFWILYGWYLICKDKISKFRKIVFIYFLIVLFLLIIASCVVKLSRGELIPFLFGLLVINFSVVPASEGSRTRVGFKLFIYALAAAAIFIIFSMIRGEFDFLKIFSDMFGYIFVPYNRMAYILDDKIPYPYKGTGIYFSSFLSFNKTFNEVVGLSEFMGWPSYIDLWRSEFQSVAMAGLNQYLIWAGAMGYLFIDFGWGAIIVFLFYGLLYKLIWSMWVSRTVLGISLYPWFAFCLAFWFGTNYLLDTKLLICMIVGILFGFLVSLAKLKWKN